MVSFATDEEVPGLRGPVAGLGGSAASQDAIGHLSCRTGEVTLDSAAFRDVIRGPDGPQPARAIVLHEFGHLVGLGHVDHDRARLATCCRDLRGDHAQCGRVPGPERDFGTCFGEPQRGGGGLDETDG